LFFSICLLIYFFGISNYLKKLGTTILENKSLIVNWIMQSMSSVKDLKISKKENKVLNIFSSSVADFEIAKKKLKIAQAIPAFVLEIIFVITAIVLIVYLYKSGMNNFLPIFSLYLVAFIRLLPVFARFGNIFTTLKSFYPSVNHLVSEFDKFKKYTTNYNSERKKKKKIKFDQVIDIRNLGFAYDNTEKKILNNFNLKIYKGEAVAFVGKSGSGKTTLINLIAGLLNPTNGTIEIDKIDYKSNILSWQSKVGLISQNPYLIDTTLLNNIIFFNEEERVNNDKLEFALNYSGLEDFVKSLPHGIETLVGEKGSFLSGGQIQRIALARLLYRDPEVLILDEFTNSLDPNNETFILNQLEKLKKEKKKTLIIISHKIKPLRICDKIIMINDRKVHDIYDYNTFDQKFGILYD
jgi:ABC-type bacteriocin/lantibiotic exporter with double-glycine peptidase domain